jgi:hypothetical protein
MSSGFVARLWFVATAEHDNWEKGAGYKADGTEDNSRWSISADHMNTVLSVKDRAQFEGALSKHLESVGLDLADFVIFEDGRLTGNRDEDENGAPLDGNDCQSYHERQKQLYLVDYDIYFELLPEEREPTIAELHELLPSVGEY